MVNKNIVCDGNLVSLRALKKSDYQIISNWEGEENNFNYFPNSNFLNDIKNPFWIENKIKDINGLYLAIVENDLKNIIGITLLENIDQKNKNACWGIYMSNKKYRNLNYCLESSFVLINYAFNHLKLNKVYNNTLLENKRGRNFHKILGFKEEAIFNNQVMIDGYYSDLIWSSIERKNWIKFKVNIEKKLTKVQ
mgnify:FL=1|tara:strand:+ start:539 stop:1120 length:582 start_codon:yes stop_codon:yes gene_type:complete